MRTTTIVPGGISSRTLRELAEVKDTYALSLYMPVRTPSVKNPKTQENMIQLKSLERKATHALSEYDVDVDTMLRPVREAIELEKPLWHPSAQGFAFFASAEGTRALTLPIEASERVIVDSQYYVKPLVSALSHVAQFYVLSLDQQRVTLSYGDAFSIERIAGPDELPTMPEVLAGYDFEPNLNAAPGAREGVRFGGEPNIKSRLVEFLEELDEAVVARIGRDSLPVVPVGVEYVVGHYKKVSKLQELCRDFVHGSPSSLSEKHIRNAAWEIVQREKQEKMDAALAQLDKIPAEDRIWGLSQVLKAAYEGTVRTVYFDAKKDVPGHFDPVQERVTFAADEGDSGARDLLNLAALMTLRTGGTAYDVDTSTISGLSQGDPIVALHR